MDILKLIKIDIYVKQITSNFIYKKYPLLKEELHTNYKKGEVYSPLLRKKLTVVL